MMETGPLTDWTGWQGSWDRQQEWYLPDREERFRVMLDMVEACVGSEAKVLDLACGTGSITQRLLRRFPAAASTGVDLDPALLTIARGYFAKEPQAGFVTADLRDPGWTAALPHRRYDAVLTATALHWLQPEPLSELYRQVAGVVREGGIFLNADVMPDESTPRINAAERAFRHARRESERAAGVQDWRDWWRSAAVDPVLAEPTARRFEIFGNHTDGASRTAEWHAEALRRGGFAEARTVWRSVPDAMVLALK